MTEETAPGLAHQLAQIAREINAAEDLEATLTSIVESAVASLPSVDAASISVAHRDGALETRAGTAQLVWDLDHVQYELREGPCVYSIERTPVVKVENVPEDDRWPRYLEVAASRGVRAQMGLQLYLEDQTLGGLNLYSLSSGTISAETEHMAELFATHAALALGKTRRESQLKEAISSRQRIGQATGIVMERFGVDEQQAFSYLTRLSSVRNTKLREIAQGIVDEVTSGGPKRT